MTDPMKSFCPECAAAGHDPDEWLHLAAVGNPAWRDTEERSQRPLSVRQREEIQALLPQLTPWVRNQETLEAPSKCGVIERNADGHTNGKFEDCDHHPGGCALGGRRGCTRRGETRSVFISRILRTAMKARRDAWITRRLNELFADENVVNEQERITREVDSAGTDWSDEEWE